MPKAQRLLRLLQGSTEAMKNAVDAGRIGTKYFECVFPGVTLVDDHIFRFRSGQFQLLFKRGGLSNDFSFVCQVSFDRIR
jgi:hypothetical protein